MSVCKRLRGLDKKKWLSHSQKKLLYLVNLFLDFSTKSERKVSQAVQAYKY